MFKCPKCGSDTIDVCVKVWTKVIQDDPDNIQTDTDGALDHDHEWDDDSPMRCRECGHTGRVIEFDTEGREDGPTMYKCHMCGEAVKESDLRGHLIDHAPAFGAADPNYSMVLAQFDPIDKSSAG